MAPDYVLRFFQSNNQLRIQRFGKPKKRFEFPIWFGRLFEARNRRLLHCDDIGQVSLSKLAIFAQVAKHRGNAVLKLRAKPFTAKLWIGLQPSGDTGVNGLKHSQTCLG